jgi:acetyltransferase
MRERSGLQAILAPRRVAVIGASEKPGSVGRSVFENLTSGGFSGEIHPVNTLHASVLGAKAYTAIADVPAPVDLAVIVTPATTVPDVIGQCADAGVGGAIVISAGFRETGAAGAQLEREMTARARAAGMRIVGPNCLGVIVPRIGLNATFASRGALGGSVGFVSQSGALCTAILDWGHGRGVGFSHFISAGTMADVGFGDYIDYLADDTGTTSILLYVESVGDAAAFVSAAREAAAAKPVIVMKSGRSPAAAHAAASHTGALAGSDVVFDAALRRCGAMRVDTIEDLFDMADVLAKRSRPSGKRLAVLTNAGGPGVIAADALAAGGAELAQLSAATIAKFDSMLPAYWSRANPVDILGDADPVRYERALETLHDDPGADAVLVIYAPTGIAAPAEAAAGVVRAGASFAKPLYASWMGGEGIQEGSKLLDRAGIPTFPFPEDAVRAFDYLWRYDEDVRGLYETPRPLADPVDAAGAESMLVAIRASGRTVLSGPECSALLGRYGLSIVRTAAAGTPDEAVAAADSCGWPVAVKLHSRTLLHKTDVGGVALDIRDPDAVCRAFDAIRDAAIAHGGPSAFEGVLVQPMVKGDGYELILGSTVDAQFGPVVAFGLGGQLVEVFRDTALGLPPLNATLALRLMERTKVFRALQGIRGRAPVDLDALTTFVVRFASLVAGLPEVKEIDLNPLYAGPERIVALDARVILHDPSIPAAALPRSIIRPYPAEYVSSWRTPDGAGVTVRPIRPEDEPLLRTFQASLSDETVRLRYAHLVGLDARTAHARLARSCFVDYRREIALVALRSLPRSDVDEMMALGQVVRTRDPDEAEFAMLVGDAQQRKGLGTELLRRLVAVARAEGLRRLVGYILAENDPMRRICAAMGFELRSTVGSGVVTAVKLL